MKQRWVIRLGILLILLAALCVPPAAFAAPAYDYAPYSIGRAEEIPIVPADTGRLRVEKTCFAPEEEIVIHYTGLTQEMMDRKAWICVADRGAPSNQYKNWKEPTAGSGTLTLQAPYQDGDYEIRFFVASSSMEENLERSTTIAITVERPELTKDITMSVEKTLFAPEEEIVISYTGVTQWLDDHGAWFCIAEPDAPSNQYKNWQEPPVGSGSVTLKAPFDEGEYELRFFDSSSSIEENRVRRLTIPFSVLHSELTKDVAISVPKTRFAPAEEIVVSYTGVTEWLDSHGAWICVADRDAAPNQYRAWREPSAGSGTVTLEAPRDEGVYEIRFFDGSSSIELNWAKRLTLLFAVGDAEIPVTSAPEPATTLAPMPTATPTLTPTPIPTATLTPTPTFTPTSTPTSTPTPTLMPTPAPTKKARHTPEPTPSPTPEPASTPIPAGDVRNVSGAMSGGPLTLDHASVSFQGKEPGQAVLLEDPFGNAGPDGKTGQVYALCWTDQLEGPISVAFDREQPGEEETYAVYLGIPVRDRNGKSGVEWVPLDTEWVDGRARASFATDGIDDYLANIQFDGVAETAAVWTNNTVEFLKSLSLVNLYSNSTIYISNCTSAVYIACSSEHQLKTFRFTFHIPHDDYDKTGKTAGKIWPADLIRVAEDLEDIYSYYDTRYDVSPRKKWPMNVCIVHPSAKKDYVASFNMPYMSIGGRFGSNPIDDSFMRISFKYLCNGYRRGTTPTSADGKVYGALGHEMFHFVQRCYISLGGTQKWFDESSAAYFDYVFYDEIGCPQVEENYNIEWPQQFSMLTNNPSSSWEYGRMPVFSYLMQEDDKFLEKAYAYLKKTGGFTSWGDVFEAATKKKMRLLVRDYFDALITKGSVPHVLGATFEPWKIYQNIRDYRETSSRDEKDWGYQWYSVYGEEMVLGFPDTVTGDATIMPYSAKFFILNLTNVPANDTSFDLKLLKSGVYAKLFDLSGESYANVSARTVDPKGTLANIAVNGHRYLLMLVNETSLPVMGDCFQTRLHGEEQLQLYVSTEDLNQTFKGTVSYFEYNELHSQSATAEVTSDEAYHVRVVLKCPGRKDAVYEGTFDQLTGRIGDRVCLFKTGQIDSDSFTGYRLDQGSMQLVIHDQAVWAWKTPNPEEVRELLVFTSSYESDFPELDLTVTWNNQQRSP